MNRRTFVSFFVVLVLIVSGIALWFLTRPAPLLAGAELPPGRSQVAFFNGVQGGDRDLYLLDLESEAVIQITQGGRVRDARWLPDGDHMLLHVHEGGEDDSSTVYVLDLTAPQGSDALRQVITTNLFPALRPDGAYVAVGRGRDGLEIRPLTRDVDPITVTGRDPAWSADGAALAYVHNEQDDGATLYVASADGSEPRPLVTVENALLRVPAWSPDATQIAYLRSDNPPGTELWMVDVASGESRYVAGPTLGDNQTDKLGYPEWAASGDAFSLRMSEFGQWGSVVGQQLYLMNPATGEARYVGDLYFRTNAYWSPEGDRLLYTDQAQGPCIVNADSGDRECIDGDSFPTRYPVWGLDGQHVAYMRYPGSVQQLCVVAGDLADWRCYQDGVPQEGLVYPLGWRP